VLPVVLPVLSVALLVLLAVTDVRMPGVREFWAEHAMLTNLLSSVLFVVLGLTIVNGWLRWREARRVRLVIIVAFASVGRFLLAYRRIMWFLLYGGRFLGDPDFRVTDAQSAALRDVLARHGLSEVDEHVAVQDDEGSAARQMHARLCILAADLDWVLLAHDLLRNTFFRSRIVLSRWASLLVITDVSSAVLQEMAEQAYEAAIPRSAVEDDGVGVADRRPQSPPPDRPATARRARERAHVHAHRVDLDASLPLPGRPSPVDRGRGPRRRR